MNYINLQLKILTNNVDTTITLSLPPYIVVGHSNYCNFSTVYLKQETINSQNILINLLFIIVNFRYS